MNAGPGGTSHLPPEGKRVLVPPARTRRPAKRALDLVVAGLALVLTTPLLIVVYVLVRVSSPGPALFRQSRLGRGEQPFDLLKFRTMYVDSDEAPHREYVRRLLAGDAEPDQGLYKLAADQRVTRVGRILRRSSIDELPQLINVLRGDMSLVGPRPALPWEAALFPAWAEPRTRVPPGLTGLWQISGRNELTMLEGLRLDVEYVAHQSLLVDLGILLRTVPTVLAAKGR